MQEHTPTPKKRARKKMPGNLKTAVFQEALATCPFCGLQKVGSLQVHHIDSNPENDLLENLIAICASCHEQVTKGLLSESDVRTKKRMLLFGVHPFAKPSNGNAVTVAHTINSGIIANKVVVQKGGKKEQIILPGSIGSEPRKYNYVEYLVKRLTKFRQAGESYGQKRSGKIHDGGTRKILENELGGLPKDLPAEDFETVVAVIQGKIDATALGRNRKSRGQSNYHSFEAHGLQKDLDD